MDSSEMEVANRNRTYASALLNEAGSSSSARATPSGVSVAAKRASEEQTESPAEESLPFGTVNDKDLCDDPNSTGHSNEPWTSGPEVVDAVFSTNWVMVGEHRCPFPAVSSRSSEEPAKLPRVIEDHKIEFERPRSGSGNRKEEDDDLKNPVEDLKKQLEDQKKQQEVFNETLMLREEFSVFVKTEECAVMNDVIKKKVLELLKRQKGDSRNFKWVFKNISFIKILRTMLAQKYSKTKEESFDDFYCRNRHHFPKFSHHGEYEWWKANFDDEILEDRLKILREAAKSWDSKRDIFLVVELVTMLNLRLHPQTNEKEKVEMFTRATRICTLLSGGTVRFEGGWLRKIGFACP